MKRFMIFMIKFYRKYLSPLKKPCCRFYPTCSEYTLQAVTKYGALKGGYMGAKRLLRCHPFSDGGYDPLK